MHMCVFVHVYMFVCVCVCVCVCVFYIAAYISTDLKDHY